jgi:protein O-GlcNAc transferase
MIALSQALDAALECYHAGQMQQAELLFQQILQAEPNHVDAMHLLGVIAAQTGRLDLAVDYLKATLGLKPDFAAAHYNLGNALLLQGKRQEAVAGFRQAVLCQPDYAAAHNSLGNALRELGHLDEAAASFRQLVLCQPDSAEAHYNLGSVLIQQGKRQEAIASFRQAVRCQPGFAAAHNHLGVALGELGHLEEAIARLKEAVRQKPDAADFHCNLGVAQWDLGNVDEAAASWKEALRLKPDAAHLHSHLIMRLHYLHDHDDRMISEECQRWNQQHAEPLKKFVLPHSNLPDPERKLRIGYVSPHFCAHAVSFALVPLLSNHDRSQFDIYCYANVASPDAITERLRRCAAVWRNTLELSDQQMADLVRSDEIDILVDLAMHTCDNRLLVFAREPAPVQVTWLAYPGTTGLAAMDYRLTDPYFDPPGLLDDLYPEEPIRLPETFWCYDPLTDEPPVNALPALKNGYITFSCLNAFWKVNDRCLTLWAKVLRSVPRSHLLLLAPRGRPREQLLSRLGREGVASSRVHFADRQPQVAYLKSYHQIDIGLDPFPCNGGISTLDALWMGVPTITLLGRTIVGRAGWSILCNLGLPELVARTPEQYAALAIQLAKDRPRLQKLRATLRKRMQQSPLMDGKRFASNVEQAYRQMWRRWCCGRQPSRFKTPERGASAP